MASDAGSTRAAYQQAISSRKQRDPRRDPPFSFELDIRCRRPRVRFQFTLRVQPVPRPPRPPHCDFAMSLLLDDVELGQTT